MPPEPPRTARLAVALRACRAVVGAEGWNGLFATHLTFGSTAEILGSSESVSFTSESRRTVGSLNRSLSARSGRACTAAGELLLTTPSLTFRIKFLQ